MVRLESMGKRDREICELVAQGLSNKEIAWRLRQGQQVIANRLREIFKKHGLANRVQLALTWHGIEFNGGKEIHHEVHNARDGRGCEAPDTVSGCAGPR